MRLFFRGGVHPPEEKEATAKKKIVSFPLPEKLWVPLVQHAGAPAKPIVKPGDVVKRWQKIGEPDGFISASVHSPVGGKVLAIENFPHPLGKQVLTVVIESTDKDTEALALEPIKDYDPLKIRERVKESGIVGLGGAGFPTAVKLSPPETKKIECVILNGAECEPYLTADHALMREYPKEICEGLRIIMLTLGAKKGYIAIEKNKPDAIEIMRKESGNEFEVVALKVKYPQGAEKQLIKSITGKEVPVGGLPFDVGVYVQNVGTAKAIYDAVVLGKPLVDRVVTVTGKPLQNPQNILTPIGVPFKSLLDSCDPFWEDVGKVIMGGPMMGIAQYTLDVPVIKGTSGILALSKKEAEIKEELPCIRCGRCVEACPMGLLPTTIALFAEKEKFDDAQRYGANSCIECGCCAYVCPAKRDLVHYIRLAKAVLSARRKK